MGWAKAVLKCFNYFKKEKGAKHKLSDQLTKLENAKWSKRKKMKDKEKLKWKKTQPNKPLQGCSMKLMMVLWKFNEINEPLEIRKKEREGKSNNIKN